LSWQNWLNSPGEAPPEPPEVDPPWIEFCGVVAPPLAPLLGVVVDGDGVVADGVVAVVVPDEEVGVLEVTPPVALEGVVPVELVAVVAVWSVVVVVVPPLGEVLPGASASAPAGTVSCGALGGMRSADCGLLPQPATAAIVSAANPAARARGTRYGMDRA
jgi:hypothetical protein